MRERWKLEVGKFYQVRSDIPMTALKMDVGAPTGTRLKLLKVTRGGMAMVQDIGGNVWQVAPRHLEPTPTTSGTTLTPKKV